MPEREFLGLVFTVTAYALFLDVNTLGRAGERTKKTSGAVGGAILIERQAVTTTKSVGIEESSSYKGIMDLISPCYNGLQE